jgi:hypothetical protein
MSAKLLSLVIVAAVLLAPVSSEAQLPRDPVERARVISQIMETQARQLTLFDRQGQMVGVVGPRDLYNQPVEADGGHQTGPGQGNERSLDH